MKKIEGNPGSIFPVLLLMRLLGFTASLILAAGCTASTWAQSPGSCATPVEGAFKSGSSLVIDSRSSGIDVTGTDKEGIRITCTVKDSRDPEEVKLLLSSAGGYNKLRIKGGGTNDNLQVHIEIPHKANLEIHMAAGEIQINQVEGDKSTELYAGEIDISPVTASEYKLIQASVRIGEVDASAFGVNKGGFFRSFYKKNLGAPYKLYAHVTTGSVKLR